MNEPLQWAYSGTKSVKVAGPDNTD